MIVFQAGCDSSIGQDVPRETVVSALLSYFYLDPLLGGRTRSMEPLCQLRDRMGWRNVMLDCGAFSADRKGKVVDLDRYCQYVQQNVDAIDVCISLDVKRDAEATRQNYLYMRTHWGLNPIPVFQLGTGEEDLRWILDNARGYFAIGNVIGHPFPKVEIEKRLDAVFALNRGYGHKIHFFGSTARWVHLRYPFYSCDSTQWLKQSAYGTYQHFDEATGVIRRGKMRKPPPRLDLVSLGMRVIGEESNKILMRVSSAKAIEAYARWITQLWRLRGVEWDDELHRRSYPDLFAGTEVRDAS